MKTPTLLSVGLSLALLTVGCSKFEDVQTPTQHGSFEEQFMKVLPILDEQHVLQVQYSTDQTDGQPTPVFYFLPRHGNPSAARQIVCQGSGIGFARCCKSWLGNHPGKCLKVYEDGGTYYADDDC